MERIIKDVYFCNLLLRDVAQPGSVLRSGRRGRRFESCHPDSNWCNINRSYSGFFIFSFVEMQSACGGYFIRDEGVAGSNPVIPTLIGAT